MSATSPYLGIGEDLLAEVESVLYMFPAGLHASAMKGDGITYTGEKDFEEGDSLSHIDISRSMEKSPRLDDLAVRLFEPDKQIRVVIVLDCTRGMEIPQRKPLIARSLLWMSALSAFRRRDPVVIYCVFGKDEGGIIRSPVCRSPEDVNMFIAAVRDGEAIDHGDPDNTFASRLIADGIDDCFILVASDFLRRTFPAEELLSRVPLRRNTRLFLAVLDGWEGVDPISSTITVVGEHSGRSREISARAGGELDRLKQDARAEQRRLVVRATDEGHLAASVPILSLHPFSELLWRLSVAGA